MIKKKLLSCLLVLSLALAMIPFASVNSYAASSGVKTLVKTKTVTIKPGKTYTTPKFKLTKKMAFQVPLQIWLSPSDKKDPEYIKKGNYVLTLRNSKGKKEFSFKESLKYVEKKSSGIYYDDWVYIYDNEPANPGFAKGKYYFTIKNTTSRIIKVKYSVRGFTKMASKANFPEKTVLDGNTWDLQYIGKVGPGLPVIESITSSNKNFNYSLKIDKNGKIYVAPWEADEGEKTTFTIKLLNGGKKYKTKLVVKY